MQTKIILGVALLGGCSHAVSSYPDASNPKPPISENKSVGCPDFTGTYSGVGTIIQGDQTAMQFGNREYFDKVFPISDMKGWRETQSKYRKYNDGKFKGLFVDPDFATITRVEDGSVRISIGYKESLVGTFQSDYKNQPNLTCSDGKMTWGGSANIAGSSEWGSNASDFSFVIYKDSDGNLIHERRQTVRSKVLFGLPGGTANYYSVFKFNKKND